MKVTLKEVSEHSQAPAHQNKKEKRPPHFEIKTYPYDGIFERLAFMLIRPPRFVYNPEILKPKRTNIRFTAQTVDIGFELTIYRQKQMHYMLLYLHGNGSSRFEGSLFLPSLPDKVGLACFDFNGCGNREEAQYITLGQNESKEVDRAASYLKQLGYVVVGWGRSMGAVSLLKSSVCDIMVSDSAYSNLTHLCKQSSSKFLPKACCCLVHLFFPCIFCCIKGDVYKRSGLQIQEMDIEKHLKHISKHNVKKSICFIHGQEDTLISHQHSQRIYDAFDGRKMLILFEGTHNNNRPTEVIKKCFQFIDQSLTANLSESSPAYFSQNSQLKKMIQLQEINKEFLNTQNSEIKKFNQSKDRRTGSGKSEKEYLHLQTSFSNGPSKISEIIPQNHEQYLQKGQKIDMQLSENSSPESKPQNFLSVAKDNDFHLFPSLQGNQNIEIQVKKQMNVQKILKQKLPKP